jgi:hypothetical protein
MAERIVYDEKGQPVIADDGEGALGKRRVGGGQSQPQRDEPRVLRYGSNAIKMFARRPLVGVKKVKPEAEGISLDETIPPIRAFGYAPQAMIMTNEGSLYTAPMRTRMRVANEAIVITVPADPIVLPAPPVAPPDVIFQLEGPFLSGTIERIQLFAYWVVQALRNYTEITIYNQDPIPFLLAVPVQPIPRDAIVYENFSLPIPVPVCAPNRFENVIDENIDIPYELQFTLQSSGRTGQGTQVVTPKLWIRISRWLLAATAITYDWRITFADGGR